MSEGNSRPWQDILRDFLCFSPDGGEDCISEGKMSSDSIKTYFKPLMDWLDEQGLYFILNMQSSDNLLYRKLLWIPDQME